MLRDKDEVLLENDGKAYSSFELEIEYEEPKLNLRRTVVFVNAFTRRCCKSFIK